MTDKAFTEVQEAIWQEYTLEEIYWKIVNLEWSPEMFQYFIDEISKEKRK